jgi:hypothetical protein
MYYPEHIHPVFQGRVRNTANASIGESILKATKGFSIFFFSEGPLEALRLKDFYLCGVSRYCQLGNAK